MERNLPTLFINNLEEINDSNLGAITGYVEKFCQDNLSRNIFLQEISEKHLVKDELVDKFIRNFIEYSNQDNVSINEIVEIANQLPIERDGFIRTIGIECHLRERYAESQFSVK
jgi:hypothetical protein